MRTITRTHIFTYVPLALLAFVLVSSVPARSQDRGFGLGIVVGEPTGVCFKDWLTSRTAIDGAVAWSFARNSAFHLHADYLWHSFDAIHAEDAQIPLYYGIGGRLKGGDNGNARFGIRGVFGADFFIRHAPVDVFLEVAPIMDLAPATELSFNGGIGVRFFFE